MNDLTALIETLDDADAERILSTLAQRRVKSSATAQLPLTQELAQALADQAEVAPTQGLISDGELARAGARDSLPLCLGRTRLRTK